MKLLKTACAVLLSFVIYIAVGHQIAKRGLISHQLIYLRHIIVPVQCQCLDFQRHVMLFLIMYNVLR